MKRKVCKNCKLFVDGDECPICKGHQFTTEWFGRFSILDTNKSIVARKLGIKTKGEYAIKARGVTITTETKPVFGPKPLGEPQIIHKHKEFLKKEEPIIEELKINPISIFSDFRTTIKFPLTWQIKSIVGDCKVESRFKNECIIKVNNIINPKIKVFYNDEETEDFQEISPKILETEILQEVTRNSYVILDNNRRKISGNIMIDSPSKGTFFLIVRSDNHPIFRLNNKIIREINNITDIYCYKIRELVDGKNTLEILGKNIEINVNYSYIDVHVNNKNMELIVRMMGNYNSGHLLKISRNGSVITELEAKELPLILDVSNFEPGNYSVDYKGEVREFELPIIDVQSKSESRIKHQAEVYISTVLDVFNIEVFDNELGIIKIPHELYLIEKKGLYNIHCLKFPITTGKKLVRIFKTDRVDEQPLVEKIVRVEPCIQFIQFIPQTVTLNKPFEVIIKPDYEGDKLTLWLNGKEHDCHWNEDRLYYSCSLEPIRYLSESNELFVRFCVYDMYVEDSRKVPLEETDYSVSYDKIYYGKGEHATATIKPNHPISSIRYWVTETDLINWNNPVYARKSEDNSFLFEFAVGQNVVVSFDNRTAHRIKQNPNILSFVFLVNGITLTEKSYETFSLSNTQYVVLINELTPIKFNTIKVNGEEVTTQSGLHLDNLNLKPGVHKLVGVIGKFTDERTIVYKPEPIIDEATYDSTSKKVLIKVRGLGDGPTKIRRALFSTTIDLDRQDKDGLSILSTYYNNFDITKKWILIGPHNKEVQFEFNIPIFVRPILAPLAESFIKCPNCGNQLNVMNVGMSEQVIAFNCPKCRYVHRSH